MSAEQYATGQFPSYRPRRMRQSESLRRLVREADFSLDQLIMPYFVREGLRIKEEISAMPGQFRFSPDMLIAELEELTQLGVRAILLFGIPDSKDERALSAWSKQGIVQKTVCKIKKNFKDLLVITDVCLCAYMNHGHCGAVNSKGEIDNDLSLEILADTALSHAEAGADMVAPSDMMDGRIHRIREILERSGFKNLPIMGYSAKYASAFYGPFRDAAHSAPDPAVLLSVGTSIPSDRKSYQMDPANIKEAMREIAMDIQEGADIVMVKPALAYLDVIREAARTFNFPLAAYSVSGEYSMIKLAAQKGILDEKSAVLETITSFVRAGVNALITYHAKDIARWKILDKEADLKSSQGVITI